MNEQMKMKEKVEGVAVPVVALCSHASMGEAQDGSKAIAAQVALAPTPLPARCRRLLRQGQTAFTVVYQRLSCRSPVKPLQVSRQCHVSLMSGEVFSFLSWSCTPRGAKLLCLHCCAPCTC